MLRARVGAGCAFPVAQGVGVDLKLPRDGRVFPEPLNVGDERAMGVVPPLRRPVAAPREPL